MFIARPHVMLLLRNQPPHLLNNVKLQFNNSYGQYLLKSTEVLTQRMCLMWFN